MIFDLHIHTTYSDGNENADSISKRAKEGGLAGICITDHDTVDGMEEKISTINSYGLKTLKGIEFSAFDGDEQVHILGYNIDDNESFRKELQRQAIGRVIRNNDTIEKLKSIFGIYLENDDFEEHKGELTRTHIAKALVNKGHASSLKEAYDKYIGYTAPAYSSIDRVTPEESIRLILENGGTPVLAHLGCIKKYDDDRKLVLVKKLVDAGLEGIESYYSTHTEKDIKMCEDLAKKYNLIETNGSDYHGMFRVERVGGLRREMNEKSLLKLKLI